MMGLYVLLWVAIPNVLVWMVRYGFGFSDHIAVALKLDRTLYSKLDWSVRRWVGGVSRLVATGIVSLVWPFWIVSVLRVYLAVRHGEVHTAVEPRTEGTDPSDPGVLYVPPRRVEIAIAPGPIEQITDRHRDLLAGNAGGDGGIVHLFRVAVEGTPDAPLLVIRIDEPMAEDERRAVLSYLSRNVDKLTTDQTATGGVIAFAKCAS